MRLFDQAERKTADYHFSCNQYPNLGFRIEVQDAPFYSRLFLINDTHESIDITISAADVRSLVALMKKDDCTMQMFLDELKQLKLTEFSEYVESSLKNSNAVVSARIKS